MTTCLNSESFSRTPQKAGGYLVAVSRLTLSVYLAIDPLPTYDSLQAVEMHNCDLDTSLVTEIA